MGKIITLMNEKGGVGKSSLTYSVAWELAKNHQKVLIIDMDGQMANITYLAGVKTRDDTKTMNDVLLHNTSIKDAIVRSTSGIIVRFGACNDGNGRADDYSKGFKNKESGKRDS